MAVHYPQVRRRQRKDARQHDLFDETALEVSLSELEQQLVGENSTAPPPPLTDKEEAQAWLL